MQGIAAGVLTRTDVHKIRRYVQHKYSELPTERRAEIVADAMQRVLLRHLPDLPKTQKMIVMRTVLREVAVGQGIPVSDAHIFEACMKLDIAEWNDATMLASLHAWAEHRLGADIAFERFRNAVEEGSRIVRSQQLGVDFVAWDAVIGAVGLHGDRTSVRRTLMNWLRRRRKAGVYLALSLVLAAAMLGYGWLQHRPAKVLPMQPTITAEPIPAPSIVKRKNELPVELRYVDIDRGRLKEFLKAKSSLLADDPYMDAIITAAREHDIHPLLLFAITGQEQAFVPRNAKNAREIANNPFNVFFSWEAFNTTIADSAGIAGNTINRLSFKRPGEIDAVTWINREYAEDPNWSKGVNSIFKAMVSRIMTDK